MRIEISSAARKHASNRQSITRKTHTIVELTASSALYAPEPEGILVITATRRRRADLNRIGGSRKAEPFDLIAWSYRQDRVELFVSQRKP